MVVLWALLLAVAVSVEAAVPDPPNNPGITTVGSLKLATAEDCAGVVAFSATDGSPDLARLVFAQILVNRGVGYVAQTGIFVTHCPGLYQFSFAGYGSVDLLLSLKKKVNGSDVWRSVVSNGGANTILMDMEAGDQVAVFVESGKVTNGVTFSGHRIAKK